MISPYVLIEGKQMRKKPDLSKLDSLEKSYKLDAFSWIINQTPDLNGNIAVFKEELDRMELEDYEDFESTNDICQNPQKSTLNKCENEDCSKSSNVSEYLGEYEVEIKDGTASKNDVKKSNKQIILFMPKEITKKYFDVIMSEEIYCRTEDEIIEQLERMYNDPLYVDYIKDLLKVVKKEIDSNNLFKDGSLLLRKPIEIRFNNDTFYSIYWVYRDTCCGSRCSGCQMFYFPNYSVNSIKKFVEKRKI